MSNGYVIAGWVATLAAIGMYAYRTVVRSRLVAARLLAMHHDDGVEVAADRIDHAIDAQMPSP